MCGGNMLILCTMGLLCIPTVAAQDSETAALKRQVAALQAKLNSANRGKPGKVTREVNAQAQQQSRQVMEKEKRELLQKQKQMMKELLEPKEFPRIKHHATVPPTESVEEYRQQMQELAGDSWKAKDDDQSGFFGSWPWYYYVILAALVGAVGYKYDLGKYLLPYLMDIRRVLIPGYGHVNTDYILKAASKAERDDLYLASQASGYGGATLTPSWDTIKPKKNNRSDALNGPLGPLAPAGPLGPLGSSMKPAGSTKKMDNSLGSIMKPISSIGSNPLDDDLGL